MTDKVFLLNNRFLAAFFSYKPKTAILEEEPLSSYDMGSGYFEEDPDAQAPQEEPPRDEGTNSDANSTGDPLPAPLDLYGKILYGTSGNDRLFGKKQKTDIFGLAGNDVITPRAYTTLVNGGSGRDTVRLLIKDYPLFLRQSSDGYAMLEVNLGNGKGGNDGYVLRYGFTDWDSHQQILNLESIERAVIIGRSFWDALSLLGSDANNAFIVRSNAPARVDMGHGNNYFRGGSGDDLIHAHYGNDLIRGGRGRDTVTYENLLTPGQAVQANYDNKGLYVEVNLAKNFAQVYDANGKLLTRDRMFSIENIRGSENSDKITGNRKANEIWGGGGDDVIWGRGGNDSLYGEAGNDTLFGGSGQDKLYGSAGSDVLYGDAGRDRLYGGSGDDYLYGGAGDDVLVGGVGNDILYGGTGRDRFVFDFTGSPSAYSFGNNKIMDFEASGAKHDWIDLSHIKGLSRENLLFSETKEANGLLSTVIRFIDKNGKDLGFGQITLFGVTPSELGDEYFLF